MITLLLGQSGGGKSREIYKRLSAASGDALFFVPDQFMFEAEKKICEMSGGRATNIKVAGFSSLSEEILKKYAPRKTYADNSAKLIIMMRVLRALSGTLKYYTIDTVGKKGFAELMLDTLGRLKSAGVTPERLDDFAPKTDEADLTELGDKLNDLSTIYRLYNKQLTQIYDDRQDNLLLAAKEAMAHGWFTGYEIFIDGFDDFTGSQLEFLRVAVTASRGCTAAFTTCKDDKQDCFYKVNAARREFERMAANNAEELREEWYDEPTRYVSKEIKYLRERLFSEKPAARKPSANGDIKLFTAPDTDSEADFIAASIKKLMREGYRCSEIAVLCTVPEKYLETIKSAFLRYDIPLFADIPERMSDKPLIRAICALLAAADDPVGEKVVRFLKSGFVRFLDESGKSRPVSLAEINDIDRIMKSRAMEKYLWTRPFSRCKMPYEQRAEELREKTVTLLLKLKAALDGCADGRQMTERLTDFLFDDMDISAAIQGKCQDRGTEALLYDKALTDEYNALWEMTSKLLSCLWETTEGVSMSIAEYASTFALCAKQLTLSLPPQVLDSVIFGDPSRTRTAGARAVFVIGAQDGAFPKYEQDDAGLFTDKENALLLSGDIKLTRDSETAYSSALLAAYKALTLPKERLTVTRTGTVGESCEVFELICGMFDNMTVNQTATLSAEYFCESIGSARTAAARAKINDPAFSETVSLALKKAGDDIFPPLIERAYDGMSESSYIHDAGKAAPLIFNRNMLSPTGIKLLNSCRFAYFIKYGLKISEDKRAKMTPAGFGDIVHFVLSGCFDRLYSGGKPDKLDESDISALVDDMLNKFIEQKLPPEISARYAALCRGVKPLCVMMIGYMTSELKKSEFRPTYFELSLKNKRTLSDGLKVEPFIMKVPLTDGTVQEVGIYGTVDRIDLADADDGKKWIRVIDYKTGEQDMSLKKVYYGLDLQLLLYLFTLCANNTELMPSAANYYPAGASPFKEAESEPSEDDMRDLWLDEHSEKGITVANSLSDREKPLYDAIKEPYKGKARANYYRSTVVDNEALSLIKERVCDVIRDNVKLINGGDVSAVLIKEKDKALSCKYCEYSHICGRQPDISAAIKDIYSDDAYDFEQKIKGESE